MNTYYCKCGMQVQSSANGATTALKNPERYYPNHLHEYGETSDLSCKGCPYICIRKQYARKAGDPSVTETHEARMSKVPPVYVTRAVKWNPSDVTVCKVHTLDFDFAKRFTDAEKTIDGIMEDRYYDRPDYQISQYNADGMFTLTVNPEPGKRGIAAKQQLWDMFFLPGGYRKDLSPDEEKEKILRGIVAARQTAQGKGEQQMSYKSEDVYVSPEGVRYRIHYDQNVKAYHTEVNENGEWKPHNSSWYPHFPHACGEFDAVMKIHNLIKQEGKACNTNQPEHAGSELIAAAEAQDVSPAGAESAISTLPDAEAASLAPAFDYSGLDAQTVATLHSAENMIKTARRDYVLKVADAVAMVHDELCSTVVAKCDNGKFTKKDSTFCAWCASVGISKDTAHRLLQVSNLLEASTPNEQKILEAAPASLLYAAAKPSAPPELVQQVKSGDITTNKQFQEALAAKKAAEAERDAAQARADKAEKVNAEQAKQLEASRGLVKMLKEHKERVDDVAADRDMWKARAEEAESRPVEVAIDESASEKRAQEIAAEYRKEDQETIARLRAALANQQHTTESDDADNFEIGLQFCETFRSAWHLARKACMALAGEDRYQMCANIQNIIKEIKGDMSHGSSENHRV